MFKTALLLGMSLHVAAFGAMQARLGTSDNSRSSSRSSSGASDNRWWRDQDGDSCRDYRNHWNTQSVCTAWGYEDALTQCARTCGPYKQSDSRNPTCADYKSCSKCVPGRPSNNDECSWDENSGWNGECKSSLSCDFNEQPVAAMMVGGGGAAWKPTVSVCIANIANCFLEGNGVIEKNTDVGSGCTTHDQCRWDQYCYSCDKCKNKPFSNCGECDWDANRAGDCGEWQMCREDKDSINGWCPN